MLLWANLKAYTKLTKLELDMTQNAPAMLHGLFVREANWNRFQSLSGGPACAIYQGLTSFLNEQKEL